MHVHGCHHFRTVTEAVARQIAEAKKLGPKTTNAGSDAKTRTTGRSAYSGQKTAPQRKPKPEPLPTDAEEAEEYVPSSVPVTPQPRFYRSTATVEGLGSARLVGFSEEQWTTLVPLLTAAGFRPY